MSKKVTIPTDGMNPFVVTHNGEKYVFTPGETVEVSDGVALEIEEYKRWREKYYGTIDPPYEGGGDIEELIVTENGTYTPPEGVDGYAPVTVAVVPPESDIDALIDGSLTEITSGAKKVGEYKFYYNTNLIKVCFPSATQVSSNAFQACTKLVQADMPSLTWIGSTAFLQCSLLERAIFPLVTSINSGAFYTCSSLKIVDLSSMKKIPINIFNNNYSLKAFLLRSETMSTLDGANPFTNCYRFHGTVNATYNPDGLKDGYIYVPRALIEDYKVATNWVTFADQFRALEDYTVDGTTTGELDESKVNA